MEGTLDCFGGIMLGLFALGCVFVVRVWNALFYASRSPKQKAALAARQQQPAHDVIEYDDAPADDGVVVAWAQEYDDDGRPVDRPYKVVLTIERGRLR